LSSFNAAEHNAANFSKLAFIFQSKQTRFLLKHTITKDAWEIKVKQERN